MTASLPCVEGAVLDIESMVDEDAAAWAGGPQPARRSALHRIVCASVLRFTQSGPHGEIGELDLRTFSTDGYAEAEIVGFVDRMLPDADHHDTRLISWNGRAADLRLLRHRACALWMFGLPNLRSWCSPANGKRHLDMMTDANDGLGRGSWWSLRDVCAGMSVSLRPGEKTSVAGNALAGNTAAIALRNRRDVVGTLLAYAHWDSFRRGCPLVAASAWRAVGALKAIDPERPDGSANLAHHHLVEMGRSHYGSGAKAWSCNCQQT